jgi:hypothetical protein
VEVDQENQNELNHKFLSSSALIQHFPNLFFGFPESADLLIHFDNSKQYKV